MRFCSHFNELYNNVYNDLLKKDKDPNIRIIPRIYRYHGNETLPNTL